MIPFVPFASEDSYLSFNLLNEAVTVLQAEPRGL
jgi:hypothetical protein